MKYFAIKMSVLSLLFLGLVSCFNSSDNSLDSSSSDEGIPSEKTKTKLRLKTVYGDIIIELDHEQAPLTSDRIKALAAEGFYNGLNFHRVIPGHIIQTGDPTGSGEGGSGQNIPFEKNQITHTEGTVSMARSEDDINSADSQFFICLRGNQKLDGIYAAFGKVTQGLEVAKKITEGDKIITLTVE